MTEPDRLFIDLEPPAGGLLRLQRHVASARPARPLPKWQLAWAFATLVLVVGCLWLPATLTQWRQNAALVQSLRQAIAPSADGAQVIDGAAVELPSGQSDVRVYLVQAGNPATRSRRD